MTNLRSCVVCHALFAQRHGQQCTCSNRCYMFNRRNPDKPDVPAWCRMCGDRLPDARHRAKVYCSSRCSAAYSKRRCRAIASPYMRHTSCAHCGVELDGDSKAGRQFCGMRCEARERAYPGSASFFASRCCEYCDQPIPVEARSNKRHCTDRCTVLANQVVRRARRAGRPVERISRLRIFKRDGWVCHICGDVVDPLLKGPDPFSASIDHLIPFCDSGSPGHVAVNVALAHRKCNVAKNGRTRPEDWALHMRLVAAAALGLT